MDVLVILQAYWYFLLLCEDLGLLRKLGLGNTHFVHVSQITTEFFFLLTLFLEISAVGFFKLLIQ